jgi:hypothetical protein
MNWDVFCKAAKECTSGSFSLDSLSNVFRSLGLAPPRFSKPQELFSRLACVRAWALFPAFLKLRVWLVTAPLEAQLAYNDLVSALFSKKKSERLVLEARQIEVPHDVVKERIALFEKNMASLESAIFQNFAAPFSRLVSEQQALLEKIDLQEKALLAMNRVFLEAFAAYQKESETILRKLFQLDLTSFHDLPQAARGLMNRPYVTALSSPVLFESSLEEMVAREIRDFFRKKLQDLSMLVETGKERVRKQQEIEDFITRARRALERLRYYKDLSSQYDEILAHIETFRFDERELIRLRPEEVEPKLAALYEKFCSSRDGMKARLEELSATCRRLEQNFQDATRTIKRRLFEIFTGVTPFPDIAEFLEAQRLRLVAGLREWHDGFFEGNITVEEYSLKCFDLAYDHDVKQLRYDLSFRATRLREFRDVCLPLVMKLDEAKRYLTIAGLSSNALYPKLETLCAESSHFFHEIENPFRIFQHAGLYAFESANEIFRKLWIRLEEYQSRAKPLLEAVEPLLAANQKKLEHAFFLSVDDLEMALKVVEGVRPNLLGPIEHELADAPPAARWELQKQLVHRLTERFPFIEPFSFYQHIEEHKIRESLILEAKKLHERIESVKRFAKSLQSVKVFEEERVDVILEAFESQFFFEEEGRAGFEKYARWASRAIDGVTEEVLLDIGLLDFRSVFSVDEGKLQKTFYKAMERAKWHAKKVLAHLEGIEEAQALRKALLDKVSLPLPPQISVKELLEALRAIVHLFFEARILLTARQGNVSAAFEELISSARAFANTLETRLEARGVDDPIFGKPWIWQCFEVRKKIEEFELVKEERVALEPVIQKLFSDLDEYLRDAAAEDKAFVTEEKKRLLSRLDAFSRLKKETAFEHPLHYVPGFLSYFRERLSAKTASSL